MYLMKIQWKAKWHAVKNLAFWENDQNKASKWVYDYGSENMFSQFTEGYLFFNKLSWFWLLSRKQDFNYVILNFKNI